MKPSLPISLRRRAGLTLVELIISLAIMALIGTTVAAMLSAVAYGTDSGREVRSLIARSKMTTARIDAAIRESRAVLGTSDGVLVLWMRDEDEDEIADPDELRRLEFDTTAETLTSYTAAAMTAEEEDAGDGTAFIEALTLGMEFWPEAAADQLVTATWAGGVTAWTVTPDATDLEDVRLVSYRLTLRAAGDTPTVIGVAALRNAKAEP